MDIKNKIWSVLVATLMLGCATGTGPEPSTGQNSKPKERDGKVTMTLSPTTLDAVVRRIGEEAEGGIVLMHGLGERNTPGFEFKGDSYAKVVEEIAKTTKNKSHAFDGYHFIYTEGYEGLLELSLGSALDPQFSEKNITFSVGSGTYLYNAFNLLSHSLGTTIVADNLIADARCGEIALEAAPIATVLEAILRSARVPQEQLNIVSTPDYLFLGAKSLGKRPEPVENHGADYLDKQPSLYLPRPIPGKESMPFYNDISTLGQVRASMAEQLGLAIQIEAGLEKLPVNPCSMNGVTIETALKLLIWQWPVSNVHCQAGVDGLRFVELR